MIIDGQVVVGETKSNDMLKTSDKGTTFAAQRLVEAACHVGANKIVLSTTKRSWE